MALNKPKVIAAAQKYVLKGQFDKAIREYQSILDEEPDDQRTALKIAELHVKNGSLEEALAAYEKVANEYSQKGFFLKAVGVHKQILGLMPAYLPSHLALAELYRQQGLISDAIEKFKQVAGQYEREQRFEESLELLRTIVSLSPQSEDNGIRLAEAYVRKGDKQSAIQEFRNVLEQLQLNKKHADYVRVAERFICIAPEEWDVHHTLAETYLKLNDPKHALACLQPLFKHDPQDVDTLSVLAQTFLALNNPGKAIATYREIAKLSQNQGNEARYQETLRRIISIDPNDEEARVSLRARAATGALPNMSLAGQSEERNPQNRLDADFYLKDVDICLKYELIDLAFERLQLLLDAQPYHQVALERQIQLSQEFNHPQKLGFAQLHLAELIAESKPEEALKLLNELLSNDPSNETALSLKNELTQQRQEAAYLAEPMQSVSMSLPPGAISFVSSPQTQSGLTFSIEHNAPIDEDDAFGDLLNDSPEPASTGPFGSSSHHAYSPNQHSPTTGDIHFSPTPAPSFYQAPNSKLPNTKPLPVSASEPARIQPLSDIQSSPTPVPSKSIGSEFGDFYAGNLEAFLAGQQNRKTLKAAHTPAPAPAPSKWDNMQDDDMDFGLLDEDPQNDLPSDSFESIAEKPKAQPAILATSFAMSPLRVPDDFGSPEEFSNDLANVSNAELSPPDESALAFLLPPSEDPLASQSMEALALAPDSAAYDFSNADGLAETFIQDASSASAAFLCPPPIATQPPDDAYNGFLDPDIFASKPSYQAPKSAQPKPKQPAQQSVNVEETSEFFSAALNYDFNEPDNRELAHASFEIDQQEPLLEDEQNQRSKTYTPELSNAPHSIPPMAQKSQPEWSSLQNWQPDQHTPAPPKQQQEWKPEAQSELHDWQPNQSLHAGQIQWNPVHKPSPLEELQNSSRFRRAGTPAQPPATPTAHKSVGGMQFESLGNFDMPQFVKEVTSNRPDGRQGLNYAQPEEPATNNEDDFLPSFVNQIDKYTGSANAPKVPPHLPGMAHNEPSISPEEIEEIDEIDEIEELDLIEDEELSSASAHGSLMSHPAQSLSPAQSSVGNRWLNPPPPTSAESLEAQLFAIDSQQQSNSDPLSGFKIIDQSSFDQLEFYIQNKQTAEAETLLNQLLKLEPENSYLLTQQERLHALASMLGDGDGFADKFAALDDLAELSDQLEPLQQGAQLNELENDESGTLLDLAIGFRSMCQPKSAIKQLDKALNGRISASHKIEALQIKGLCLLDCNQAPEAQSCFREALEISTDHNIRASLCCDLATAYEQSGDKQSAIEILRQALEEGASPMLHVPDRLRALGG